MIDEQRIAALEQRIAQLEAQVAELGRALPHYGPPSPTAPGPPATPSHPWMSEVQALLVQGNKINAIKVYRENTGVGLAEAKSAVDAMG